MKTLPACLLAFASASHAATGQPVPGDYWVYQSLSQGRDERGPVVRSQQLRVSVEGYNTLGKPIIKGERLFGLHSDTCLYDIALGVELPGEVACDAPLTPGQGWNAAPPDVNQGGRQWFSVTGSETLTMGAKRYQATVISTVAPLIWPSGYRRSTYWYAPEVKGMMKIVHEGMDEQGVVTVTETYTLLSFQPASDTGN